MCICGKGPLFNFASAWPVRLGVATVIIIDSCAPGRAAPVRPPRPRAHPRRRRSLLPSN